MAVVVAGYNSGGIILNNNIIILEVSMVENQKSWSRVGQELLKVMNVLFKMMNFVFEMMNFA